MGLTVGETQNEIDRLRQQIKTLEEGLDAKKAERGLVLAQAISSKLSAGAFDKLMADLRINVGYHGYTMPYPHNAFHEDLGAALKLHREIPYEHTGRMNDRVRNVLG